MIVTRRYFLTPFFIKQGARHSRANAVRSASRLGRSMEARVFHLLAKEPLPFQLATCLSQLKRVVKEALIGSILGVRET